MGDETICAVIVSHNRKKLLNKCLNALINQNKTLNAICIVDNASTEDIPQMLLEKGFLNRLPPLKSSEIMETSFETKDIVDGIEIKIRYIRIPVNMGGAGGFYEGIKRSYPEGYNWFWLMDDDAIPSPNSLEVLLNKKNIVKENIGFLCSKILWKDKDTHLMNVPGIHSLVNNIPFNKYDKKGILLVKTASFVSLLLKRDAISKFGLPHKEFFIWGDDLEYTNRITDGGYFGVYVKDSVVCHNTQKNYSSNIFDDEVQNLWKYSFGIRNNLYMFKKKGIVLYFMHVFYNITYVNYYLLKVRKDNRLNFIWVNTKASLESIFFRPKRRDL